MVLKRSLLRLSLCLGLLLLVSACDDHASDPEALLRETINAIQTAAEDKDLSGMMRHVSENYQDSHDRDQRQLRVIAQFQFLQNPRIHSFKVIKSLELTSQETAEVSLLVAIAGTPIDGVSSLVNMRADMMWFDLKFHLDDQWELVSALWRPAQSNDFL